jgi:membrane protein YqaA with SNARE-associated domain
MLFSVPVIMAIIFVINIIPVFMPPTWIFLAYLYIIQGGNLIVLVLLGALFSTLGGFVLAKFSWLLGDRFIKGAIRKNIAYVQGEINKRPTAEFITSFLYALTPLPNNAIFIVAGAAKLRLSRIGLGFFLGKLVSYYLILSAAKFTIDRLNLSLTSGNHYAWIISILGLLFAMAFLMMDWKHILGSKSKK